MKYCEICDRFHPKKYHIENFIEKRVERTMDIDKFAFGCCEACIECSDTRESRICLSCKKLMFYEALKDGVIEVLDGKDYFVEQSIMHITTCIDNFSEQISNLNDQLEEVSSEMNKLYHKPMWP